MSVAQLVSVRDAFQVVIDVVIGWLLSQAKYQCCLFFFFLQLSDCSFEWTFQQVPLHCLQFFDVYTILFSPMSPAWLWLSYE